MVSFLLYIWFFFFIYFFYRFVELNLRLPICIIHSHDLYEAHRKSVGCQMNWYHWSVVVEFSVIDCNQVKHWTLGIDTQRRSNKSFRICLINSWYTNRLQFLLLFRYRSCRRNRVKHFHYDAGLIFIWHNLFSQPFFYWVYEYKTTRSQQLRQHYFKKNCFGKKKQFFFV